MANNNQGYNTPITRNNPSAIAFLVDRSGSMSERVVMGKDNITKAEAVARIINSAISEIGYRCVRADGIYNYIDVAVLGYGDNSIESLLGDVVGSNKLLNSTCKCN